MTDNNSLQQNIFTVFTPKAYTVSGQIAEKYNLNETSEKFLEKLKAGKFSNIVVVNRGAQDFVLGKIGEKDLISSLQKDLEVSPEIAEKIGKEIITNLVPLIDKVPEDQLEEYNKKHDETPKSAPSQIQTPPQQKTENKVKKPEVKIVEENEKIVKEQREKIPTSPKKPNKIISPVVPPNNEELPQKPIIPTVKKMKSSEPDSYREPLD